MAGSYPKLLPIGAGCRSQLTYPSATRGLIIRDRIDVRSQHRRMGAALLGAAGRPCSSPMATGAPLGEVTAAGRPVLMLAPGFVAAVAGVVVLLVAGLVVGLARLRTRKRRAAHRQPRVASRHR